MSNLGTISAFARGRVGRSQYGRMPTSIRTFRTHADLYPAVYQPLNVQLLHFNLHSFVLQGLHIHSFGWVKCWQYEMRSTSRLIRRSPYSDWPALRSCRRSCREYKALTSFYPILVLRFSRLEFSVKLRLSGRVGQPTYSSWRWQLYCLPKRRITQHSTRLIPERRSLHSIYRILILLMRVVLIVWNRKAPARLAKHDTVQTCRGRIDIASWADRAENKSYYDLRFSRRWVRRWLCSGL
jgi:hypothetical protein